MEIYHKINTLYKRHMEGPKKGKLIVGQWSQPEFEYLANLPWEFTEKVDGTNIRIGFTDQGEPYFGGRSDNAMIPKPLFARLETMLEVDDILSTFTSPEDVTLYGEGYGPNIQNGGNYRTEPDFVLFDVKIGDWWLYRKDVNDIADKLGIDSVPVIGTGTLADAVDIVTSGITFNDTGAVVRWGRGGLESKWGPFEAEGIVARPVVPLFDRRGERIITKIKGKDFK